MPASPLSKRLAFAGLLLAAFAGAAYGEDPAPPVKPPEAPTKNDTVHGYARSNPECLAWSNGCVICARDEKGAAHCSTPGIACIPVEVDCKVSRSK